MPPSTSDLSSLTLRSLRTKDTVSLVEAGAAEIRVPCSEAAVMPCGTTTSPELGPLGPVTAPAGATAESRTMEPAVPAAIKVPALRRRDQFAGFKVDPPVKVLLALCRPSPGRATRLRNLQPQSYAGKYWRPRREASAYM